MMIAIKRIILLVGLLLLVGCTDVPDSSHVFYKRGVDLNNNNDPEAGLSFKDAMLMFDESLRIKPNFYEGWIRRGDVAMQYRAFEEAATSYKRAILINPNAAEAYRKRGDAYYRQAKYQQASKDFQQAMVLDPSDPTAPLNLCYIYVAFKQYKVADRYCGRVLQLQPGNPYALKLQSIMNRGG
ncbi:MAG: tetratricopeptide repeat protein [Alphaproteobacteria bacterium]|nr:tetratricopeptide repeat protein [Alphaproteobacteria bacterium]